MKAAVSDGARIYRASLYLKRDQVFDYSCTCDGGRSYKGMCPHCAALFDYYKERNRSESQRPVFTSQEVRAMIREYTNREVADIMREEEGADVSLRPRLLLRGNGLQLEFDIGRERFYVLKDLASFADAVDGGTFVRYGKTFAFHHSLSAFTPKSRPMAEFLMDQIHAYRDYYAHFHRGAVTSVPGVRAIQLDKGSRDRFFRLVTGEGLEVEDNRGGRRNLLVAEENPRLEARAERSGRDGISIALPEGLLYFRGESTVYVGLGEKLYCCDGACSRALSFFLDGMMKPEGAGRLSGRPLLEVNDRDLPLFYERVVRALEPYVSFDSEEVRLEDYRPQELKARFEFDSPGKNEVVLHPVLSYGDFSFHPVEDEKVPRTVCRDVPGEFRVSQAITKYFRYRETEGNDLVIRDDWTATGRKRSITG